MGARRIGRKRYVRTGRGRVLKKKRRLRGRSNAKRDRLWKALPPGKRRSRSGKIYYEYRRNRAD